MANGNAELTGDVADVVHAELVRGNREGDFVDLQSVMGVARQVIAQLDAKGVEAPRVLREMERKGYVERERTSYVFHH